VTRIVRRIASVAAAAALAFGQLAMAVHACDRIEAPSISAPVPAHDCCEKQKPPANDCERHCDYAASSVDTHGVSTAAVAPATPIAFRIGAAAFHRMPARILERPLERRVEPPPLTLFGFLRI